ncbi:MAG: hypothetical protein ABWY93_19710 [Mycobacterium sp.]
MTTDAFTTAAPHRTPHGPNATNPAFISVADVMFGTAAAAPATPARWFRTLRARLQRPRRTYPARRADYLETAAMAREMYRL